jgi:hypothetical protein
VRFQEDYGGTYDTWEDNPPHGGISSRLAALEKRMQSVEKLAIETSCDAHEAISFCRQCFLGPSADPIIHAMHKAKEGYDELDPGNRGSPQPYRMFAAMEEMTTDEEIPMETRTKLQDFLTSMKNAGDHKHWDRYATVFRTAGTRDKAVLKLHCQFTNLAMMEFPDIVEATRIALSRRGWTPKDGTAPRSQAFKAVITSVNRRRS